MQYHHEIAFSLPVFSLTCYLSVGFRIELPGMQALLMSNVSAFRHGFK